MKTTTLSYTSKMETLPLHFSLLNNNNFEPRSSLFTDANKKLILAPEKTNIIWADCMYKHLYITSDRPIDSDECWYIDDTNAVRKAITADPDYWRMRDKYKRIEFATDPILIKHGVIGINLKTKAYKLQPTMFGDPHKSLFEVNFLEEFALRYNIRCDRCGATTDAHETPNYYCDKKIGDSFTSQDVKNAMLKMFDECRVKRTSDINYVSFIDNYIASSLKPLLKVNLECRLEERPVPITEMPRDSDDVGEEGKDWKWVTEIKLDANKQPILIFK